MLLFNVKKQKIYILDVKYTFIKGQKPKWRNSKMAGKGKPAATSLRPWQKEISKEEHDKALLSGNTREVGFNKTLNKYYRVDFSSSAYQENKAKRQLAKKARLKKRIDRAVAVAVKKAKREAVREFLASDKYKKRIMSAEKRGAASAKPKVNQAERATKLEQKAKDALKKAEAIRAKLKK